MAYELFTEEAQSSLHDLEEAVEEIDAAYDTYRRAKEYYDGDCLTGFQSTTIQRLLNNSPNQGTLNYAAIPVNTISDRLQLAGTQTGDQTIDDVISALWEANNLSLSFGQFVRDTLIYGDNYMIAWPGANPEQDAVVDVDEVALTDVAPVELTAADPLTTRMFYDYRGVATFAARKWYEKIGSVSYCRVNLYYSDRIEKYIRPQTAKKVTDFEQYLEFDETPADWPLVHDLGKIPVFHFRTEGPYGTPEHKAVYGVQDALNKIFQVHMSSVEFLGFPIIYALLDPTSAAGTSEFEYGPVDTELPVTAPTSLHSAPGELLALRATNVGQFKPAGSEDFLRSLGTYKEIAAEVSGIPARYFVSSGGQHPSADAINAADVALRQRIGDRQIQLGFSLASLLAFALGLVGYRVMEKQITVQWAPQKLEISAALIKEMEFKRSLGVPDYEILLELGYSDTQITSFGITRDTGTEPLPVSV